MGVPGRDWGGREGQSQWQWAWAGLGWGVSRVGQLLQSAWGRLRFNEWNLAHSSRLKSRTIGLKKGGSSLHWVATLGQLVSGSVKAIPRLLGGRLQECDPGSSLDGFETEGTRERAGGIKSGDLRCWTVTGREGTSPLLHAWGLPLCRNSEQGQFTQELETWRDREGRLSGRGIPKNRTH